MTPPKDRIPLLEPPVQRWECAHCNTKAVTRGQPNRFHNCPGLRGIMAPLALEEQRGKLIVRTQVREDYLGKDAGKTQNDEDGTPISSIITEHEDGRVDCAVLATVVGVSGKVG